MIESEIEFEKLCLLRFGIDQNDKVFNDEQLSFMVNNKEMIIYWLSKL